MNNIIMMIMINNRMNKWKNMSKNNKDNNNYWINKSKNNKCLKKNKEKKES